MSTKRFQGWKTKHHLAWPLVVAMSLSSTFAMANEDEEDPPPPPPEDLPTNGLSDSDTSYAGAIMLRGNHEVTMESVVPGYVGDESYQADGRYAYFSGNTL